MGQRRALDSIERDIAGAKAWLADLVREKESARKSAHLMARRQDPVFIAAMRAGIDKLYADPGRRGQIVTAARLASLKASTRRALPPLSDHQRRYYRKARSAGLDRSAALREALMVEAWP